MKNITIKNQKEYEEDRKIKLVNGSLVLGYDEYNKVVASYMVTYFRNNNKKENWERTDTYCTFINLDNGKIAFEEPCSRFTTENRILSHVTYEHCNKYVKHLKVFKNGNYGLDISLGEELN